MPNYQNGKIYKLWTPEGDCTYIGSTTQPLAVRLGGHKRESNATCSKYLFSKYTDIRIELMEDYPCNNKEQLNRREGEIIRATDCINKQIAGRTYKEYYETNKVKIAEQQKKYKEDNKTKIAEYQKNHYEKNKTKILEYQKKQYQEKIKQNKN